MIVNEFTKAVFNEKNLIKLLASLQILIGLVYASQQLL